MGILKKSFIVMVILLLWPLLINGAKQKRKDDENDETEEIQPYPGLEGILRFRRKEVQFKVENVSVDDVRFPHKVSYPKTDFLSNNIKLFLKEKKYSSPALPPNTYGTIIQIEYKKEDHKNLESEDYKKNKYLNSPNDQDVEYESKQEDLKSNHPMEKQNLKRSNHQMDQENLKKSQIMFNMNTGPPLLSHSEGKDTELGFRNRLKLLKHNNKLKSKSYDTGLIEPYVGMEGFLILENEEIRFKVESISIYDMKFPHFVKFPGNTKFRPRYIHLFLKKKKYSSPALPKNTYGDITKIFSKDVHDKKAETQILRELRVGKTGYLIPNQQDDSNVPEKKFFKIVKIDENKDNTLPRIFCWVTYPNQSAMDEYLIFFGEFQKVNRRYMVQDAEKLTYIDLNKINSQCGNIILENDSPATEISSLKIESKNDSMPSSQEGSPYISLSEENYISYKSPSLSPKIEISRSASPK